MKEYTLTATQQRMIAPEQRRYEEHRAQSQQHAANAAEAAGAMVRMVAFAFDCAPAQVDLTRLHEGVVGVKDTEKVAEPDEGE